MSKSLEAYYTTFHVHRAVKKRINACCIYSLDLFNTRYLKKITGTSGWGYSYHAASLSD